jgi:hypothetical protein
MKLLSKIDRFISESSEMAFNTWWTKQTQVYLKGNEVLWTQSWDYPIGSIVTEEDIDDMNKKGYTVIHWK